MEVKLDGKTVQLRELTMEREERLAELASQHGARPCGSTKVNDVVCAGCVKQVVWVRYGWPFNIIRKVGGCYCSNEQCEFYRVFIPTGAHEQLTIVKTKGDKHP